MTSNHTLRASILAALSLSGCETWEATSCVVAEEYGECPSADEVKRDLVGPGCGERTLSVDGEATFVDPSADTSDTGWWWYGGDEGLCCYPVTKSELNNGCVVGRPLQVAGQTRAAPVQAGSGWAEAGPSTLSPALAHVLANHWAQQARGEHASVAAFNRLSLELMQLGAPAELLEAVQQAALDEVRHAREAFALASTFAGEALAPAPLLDLGQLTLAESWEEVGLAAVVEGCIGETLAVALASAALEASTDADVRAHLSRVVRDERRHAGLSWQLLAHALRQAPELMGQVERLFAEAAVPEVRQTPSHPTLTAHGMPSPEAQRAVLADALQTVVRPCWAALRASLT